MVDPSHKASGAQQCPHVVVLQSRIDFRLGCMSLLIARTAQAQHWTLLLHVFRLAYSFTVLQVPVLLLRTVLTGNPWIKVDLCTGKMVEMGGD